MDALKRQTRAIARFRARLQPVANGCLEWRGYCDDDGYGSLKWNGKTCGAHRVAWQLATGAKLIPANVIEHVCNNPPCCNIAHLRCGTFATNNAYMAAQGRARGGAPKGNKNASGPRAPGKYDAIINLRKKGCTWRAISKALCVSLATVQRALRSEGLI